MGRIAFAWELGSGMGHIQRILPLAKKMQERGHEVICVVRHVINAEKILGCHGIKVLQAPAWQIKVLNRFPDTFNYAQILYNLGYLADEGLIVMAKAWRNLFDIIMPDLLIVDHSPTALIAARGGKIKAVLYGSGYFVPPRQNPMPSLIPWLKVPNEFLEDSEKIVTDTINAVLTELRAPLLDSLSDLFDVDENILATFQELDHYQTRVEEKYWLPVINLSEGESPVWPETGFAKKIFCYLKPNYPHLEELLKILQQIEASVICFIPKPPKRIIEKFHCANMEFAARPLNMGQVCKDSDLVICHAGHGTIAVTLLHGKPLVLLPGDKQLEQILIAQHVAKLHAGIIILTRHGKRDYRRGILRVLSEHRFTEETKKFAQKYKDFDPAKQLDEIAERCEEVMKPGT
jgi:hypothetical protein